MHRTAVINVVGLTPGLLGPHTPQLNALKDAMAPIEPVVPAVTCTAQTTYLTGQLPQEHGIVANGWYFRDLDQIWLWRQSNRLVQTPRIWDLARARNPAFTCANTFWWYAMATRADVTLTPRPLYLANGLKLPDFYCQPADLRESLREQIGQFPLFDFWGPATSIRSSAWIAQAARAVEERFAPTLQLVYLPHLDYCLQRLGPRGDVASDLAAIDAVCGELIAFLRNRGVRIVVLSEYGITEVSRPVHINRVLREAGLLAIKRDLGRDYLDTGASRAFAVADHQIAHVYVSEQADIGRVKALCADIPGVGAVLDEAGQRELGLAHERSGEIVLLAEHDSWFTYYFWLDDACAPDYARCVDIHNKPGYDPVELFLDPALRFPKLAVGAKLARKLLGFRYTMDVIPLDATLVRGSHGLSSRTTQDMPLLMTSEPHLLQRERLSATQVCGVLLDHVFED
jgi:predicted AlkP superfamily pyrophosphatase or phosphodiesterase